MNFSCFLLWNLTHNFLSFSFLDFLSVLGTWGCALFVLCTFNLKKFCAPISHNFTGNFPFWFFWAFSHTKFFNCFLVTHTALLITLCTDWSVLLLVVFCFYNRGADSTALAFACKKEEKIAIIERGSRKQMDGDKMGKGCVVYDCWVRARTPKAKKYRDKSLWLRGRPRLAMHTHAMEWRHHTTLQFTFGAGQIGCGTTEKC